MVKVDAGNVVVSTNVCVLIDRIVDAAGGERMRVLSIVGPGAVHVAPGAVHVRSMNEVKMEVSAGAVVVISIEVVSPGKAVVKV